VDEFGFFDCGVGAAPSDAQPEVLARGGPPSKQQKESRSSNNSGLESTSREAEILPLFSGLGNHAHTAGKAGSNSM